MATDFEKIQLESPIILLVFPFWTWIVGVYIGASIGSFLNALIYRMPRGLSSSEPKNSFCPICKHRLTLPDLLPLLSWLFLRGKCRHCGAKIPARYFWVELFTGGIFGAIWYQQLCVGEAPWRAVCLAIFAAALILAFFIDIKHYIIPDQVNAAMLFVGIIYNIGLYALHDPRAMTWGVPSALAGGLLGAFIIWFIALFGRIAFRKDAMGHGDIKMARGIGAMLFPAMTMASLACAVVLGTVMGVGVLIYRNILIVKGRIPAEEPEEEDDEPYVPETIPSLFKCGLGYALCFDVIGLFVPKFYENYFGENPYSVEEVQDEDEDVPITMIPFGPALALGALCAMLFEDQIVAIWASYIARFN